MKCEGRSKKCQRRSAEAGAPSTRWASRLTPHASRLRPAFTLIELLVVIAIMGLMAAIAMPVVNKLKPNVMAAATQKLLTDVGHARQLAISHHTTVYMVFVYPGYWNDTAYSALSSNTNDLRVAQQLADKQMVGYNFVSLRSIGDQPGRNSVRYLESWRTLPEGVFIPLQKFDTTAPPFYFYTNGPSGPNRAWFSPVRPFDWTRSIPFPTETATPGSVSGQPAWVNVPYIAFNYLGQLVYANGQPTGTNAFIPLSQGSVMIARDPSKAPTAPGPGVSAAVEAEKPVGNTTNAFNVINIDWLTGRARVERQEVL